jgi:hypothetical protein
VRTGDPSFGYTAASVGLGAPAFAAATACSVTGTTGEFSEPDRATAIASSTVGTSPRSAPRTTFTTAASAVRPLPRVCQRAKRA